MTSPKQNILARPSSKVCQISFHQYSQCFDFKKLSIKVLRLFDLILYVPSTIFQLNRDGSSWVEPVLSYDKCILLKDHNKVTLVWLEPVAPQSRGKHSTTEQCAALYRSNTVYTSKTGKFSLHVGLSGRIKKPYLMAWLL